LKENINAEIKTIKPVNQKNTRPPDSSGSGESQKLLTLFLELGILKKVPRTGWLWRNIPDCESIADHCYRVNLIAMMLCDQINCRAKKRGEKLNFEKVMRMAVLHEISECRIGDIPYPAQKYIGAAVKTAAETRAVQDMTAPLDFLREKNYAGLWLEFEEGKTREARLVKAADKLEMLIQAVEYEKAGAKTLEDFWRNADTFKQIAAHPAIEEILDELIKMRN